MKMDINEIVFRQGNIYESLDGLFILCTHTPIDTSRGGWGEYGEDPTCLAGVVIEDKKNINKVGTYNKAWVKSFFIREYDMLREEFHNTKLFDVIKVKKHLIKTMRIET